MQTIVRFVFAAILLVISTGAATAAPLPFEERVTLERQDDGSCRLWRETKVFGQDWIAHSGVEITRGQLLEVRDLEAGFLCGRGGALGIIRPSGMQLGSAARNFQGEWVEVK